MLCGLTGSRGAAAVGFAQCPCRRADFTPYFGTVSLLNQSDLLGSEPVDSSGNSQAPLSRQWLGVCPML